MPLRRNGRPAGLLVIPVSIFTAAAPGKVLSCIPLKRSEAASVQLVLVARPLHASLQLVFFDPAVIVRQTLRLSGMRPVLYPSGGFSSPRIRSPRVPVPSRAALDCYHPDLSSREVEPKLKLVTLQLSALELKGPYKVL